jgi:hypothetical protein
VSGPDVGAGGEADSRVETKVQGGSKGMGSKGTGRVGVGNGRAPDFIGIGVQKGGTSWLAACLDAHPGLAIPLKESKFLVEGDEEDRKVYEERLSRVPNGILVGEFATVYFTSDNAIENIKRLYPDARIILILREPRDRVRSIVRHRRMRHRELDLKTAIDWSMYSRRLERWMNAFGSQMRIIWYDDILDTPYSVVKDLYDWLGVDSEFTPGILDTWVNRSVDPRSKWVVRIFDQVGKVRNWRWMRWFWWAGWCVRLRDWAKRMNSTGDEFEFNRFETQILTDAFEEDKRELKKLIGTLPWRWER